MYPMRALAIFVPLFALLIASIWFAVGLWNVVGDAAMPTGGYVAMVLGIVFSVIVGCGLMALVFYSSRHGYDERANYSSKDDAE